MTEAKKRRILGSVGKEVRGVPLQTMSNLVQALAHTYPSVLSSVPAKEGRPRLTVTNENQCCSKLQEET